MRILFVSEYFWPRAAGAEVWAWELCTGLAKRGHQVTVLTLRHDNSPMEETASGVRIIRVADTTPHSRNRVQRMRAAKLLTEAVGKRLKADPPDVVHTVAYTINVRVSRAARRAGIPCITSVHSFFGDDWKRLTLLWPFIRRMERQTLMKDEGILHVPSAYLRKRIKDETGRDSHVVHNWLPDRLPKATPLPEGTWIFVGSLEPVKGPIVAIREAKRQGAKLMIIGTGSLEEEVWREARHAQVRVLSQASREEVLSHLAGASLCVVPSVTESFSLVALEAVAQGTPVAGNPVGILPELPGVVPWPPAEIPKRLPKKAITEVRKRFAREAQLVKFEELYMAGAGTILKRRERTRRRA